MVRALTRGPVTLRRRGAAWYTGAMRSTFGGLLVVMMACTNAGTGQDPVGSPPEPTPAFTPTPTPTIPTPEPVAAIPEPVAAVTVQMTAATLGDDCGASPPAPAPKAKSAMYKGDMERVGGRRACDPSSMQLSVVAAAGGAATRLSVKKVELLDDKGAMIGELMASAPSVWDPSGAYRAWDEGVAPGQDLSVSYALSQPPWDSVPGRRSRTYVLRAVITIGGGEQSVQRDVQIAARTSLPPGVKT